MNRVNPAPEVIRRANVVYTGTARAHHVPPMAGSVSIKALLRGSAMWESRQRQYVVNEGTWLLLDEGQEYALTIDAREPVTTYCLFFRAGFVEDAWRTAASTDGELLDDPFTARSGEIVPGLRPRSDAMRSLLARMHRAPSWDDDFVQAAGLVVRALGAEERSKRRIAAAKCATRDELRRRVQRGVDYMLSHLGDSITIESVAREACLSLFHFHRAFVALHGTTPHRFLTRERLARAAHLLRHEAHEIGDVAAAVGFESHGAFSTLFARHFGASPRAWSRRNGFSKR